MKIVSTLIIGVIIGISLGPFCVHAENSMAEPINRIARSLDNIDATLKNIEKKLR